MSEKVPSTQKILSRRIIRMAQLRAKFPLSESHIYGLIKQGKFPKPFPLVPGGRATGWYEDTIDEFLKSFELPDKKNE
jgi:prophage regulatory protein